MTSKGLARLAFSRQAAVVVGAIALLPRLIHLNQPLLENYIDRQCHTAMIARNVERGMSLFYPETDIGPFPGLYMLEFPAYQFLVAGVHRCLSLPLDATGRLVSGLATAIACGWLVRLVGRYSAPPVALLAGLTLAAFPVTIRFGRAFQPDALLLCLVVVTIERLDCWSRAGSRRALCMGLVSASLMLLVKIIAAYVLVVMAFLAVRRHGWAIWRRPLVMGVVLLIVLPSLVWYLHAWRVAAEQVSTSRASVSGDFWGVDKWVAPGRFVQFETYRRLAYFVGWRVLSPLGAVLMAVGLIAVLRLESSHPYSAGRTLFLVWAGSLVGFLPILVRKLDHEHYYLSIAPLAAIGAAVGCELLHRVLRSVSGSGFAATAIGFTIAGLLGSGSYIARSTYSTPTEWRHVTAAAAALQRVTSAQAVVAAHASVLFYADRRGYPVAWSAADVAMLLAKVGEHRDMPMAADLIEAYRRRGATYVAEVDGGEGLPREYLGWLNENGRETAGVSGRFRIIELLPNRTTAN